MAVPASAVLLAALLSAAPPSAEPPKPLPPIAPPLAAPGTATSTVTEPVAAVALTRIDTRMTVEVMVNGFGPFRFLVDSGATRTAVSDRLASLLALPPAGTLRMHSVGGQDIVPAVRIDALRVGNLSTRAIVAPILLEDNLGVAGIIGLDALEGGRVVIDLRGNRMTIERTGTKPEPAGDGVEIVVTARRRFGQLVFADADANGQKTWAVVDTGSMATIGNGVLRDRLIRKARANPALWRITDVAGHEILASYAPLAELRLSKSVLHDVVVAFSDAHAFTAFGLADKPALLLGMDMMRAFDRVSIDFGSRKVRLFKRYEVVPPTAAPGGRQ